MALAAVTAVTSCEDHRSDYMEEFQTMVYFRNGGEQSLTLFRTGEDGLYRIPVCKSGRNLEGTASATVMPFDEAQLSMYNIKNETSYKLIPSGMYTFVDDKRSPLSDQKKVKLSFGADDSYQVVNLGIKTVALSALQESDPDSQYVLGLQVFSEGNVSDDINIIILKPEIEIPYISLVAPGVETHKYTSASQTKQTYSNRVSLNMDENLWDFTCSIAVQDEAWLAAYNAAQDKDYTLLPADCYTLSGTTLTFAKGELEAPFSVEINRENMEMLKEYALPIRITDCSKEEFSIDEGKDLYLLNLRLDPDQITITSDMISVSADQGNDGTGAPALIDDNTLTYWHSPWGFFVSNADPVYGVWIDIALKTPLKSIVFTYNTRSQNTNGVPTHVVVGVSADGTSYTVIGEAQTDEMASAGAGQEITLPVMTAASSFRYIRFGIAESVAGDLRQTYTSGSQPWTSLSELKLFGSD